MKWLILILLVSCSTPSEKFNANAPLAGSANGFMFQKKDAGIDYYFQFDKKPKDKWLKLNLVLLNHNKKVVQIKSQQFSLLIDGVTVKSVEKITALKALEKSVKEHRPPEGLPLLFTDDPKSDSKKLYTNELVLVERYMLDPELSLPGDSTMKTYVLFELPSTKLDKFLLRLNDQMDVVKVELAD